MYHWTRCSLLRSRDRLYLGSDAAIDSGQRPARCHRDHHGDRGWRSGQHLAQGREAVRVVRDRSRHELFGLPGGWAYHSTAPRCCSFGGCLLLCRSPRQMLPLRRSSVEGEGRVVSCPTRERTSRVARARFIDEGNPPQGVGAPGGRHGWARGR